MNIIKKKVFLIVLFLITINIVFALTQKPTQCKGICVDKDKDGIDACDDKQKPIPGCDGACNPSIKGCDSFCDCEDDNPLKSRKIFGKGFYES